MMAIDRLKAIGWSISAERLQVVAEEQFDGSIESAVAEVLNIDLKKVLIWIMNPIDLRSSPMMKELIDQSIP